MIELPEAITIARQLNQTVPGRTVLSAVAGASPHGFAWYEGDPAEYGGKLNGKKITGCAAYGGRVEIELENMRLDFNDGVNVRYFASQTKRPLKHQLLLELDDGAAIVCTVQMYGGMMAFEAGTNDSFYYSVAKEKPSPLADEFDAKYFESLLSGAQKLSAKAFLATEQRIPGLGNGVLQDILWRAKIHPKTKMGVLSSGEADAMLRAVKTVLAEMTEKGGRDTEKDLFGAVGGYQTALSRNTIGLPCPECGAEIRKMAYLGGNVYVCGQCQRERK